MVDVIESKLLETSHKVGESVLTRLKQEHPADAAYVTYVMRMRSYGYNQDLARKIFHNLGNAINPDMTIEFSSTLE